MYDILYMALKEEAVGCGLHIAPTQVMTKHMCSHLH